MRTTVTLDDDVAARVVELAHQRKTSFKAMLNELIRRGLTAQQARSGRRRRFRVVPHPAEFRVGVDPLRLNQLVDELETADFVTESRE